HVVCEVGGHIVFQAEDGIRDLIVTGVPTCALPILGGREETWPRLLARTHSVEVVDLSHVGADVKSALRQADGLPAEGGLVLLEKIGRASCRETVYARLKARSSN